METSLASVQVLVTNLKEEMFSKVKSEHFQSFVSTSAYDTAWLAMIPHPVEHNNPMFKGCLEWLVDNQKEHGYWGESVNGDLPTIDALPATIASMAVLQKWGLGAKNIEKGLKFVQANMVDMLHDQHHHLPRWFSIVFPATIELAESSGIGLNFCDHTKSLIAEISNQRQQILCMEVIVDKWQNFPLLAYLETFQSAKYDVDQETITKHLSEDGSLFQSPSATAQAYISTGNPKCLEYLQSLVEKCPNGVPQKYPMDEELVELSMVDQVQRLGLSEYFSDEIDQILRKVYRNYMVKEYSPEDNCFIAEKLFKDSLAFRLFRMHGYNICPSIFCWFLHDNEILHHLEHNYGQFSSVLYSVYKATDLFFGETEVQEARSFSRNMLQKLSPKKNMNYDNIVIFPDLLQMIYKDISTPWISRLDHLDHRMWIEQNKEGPMWIGKASFYRLSCVHNMELMQLALQNYKFKQLTYQNELEELRRWSTKWGLTEMGFGREKTLYCYFAVSASTSLPHDSLIRMLVAKNAILITVADDFFDMRGSIEELHILIDAINRWDGEGLSGPSKVIFDVLDDLVRDVTKTLVLQGKIDLTEDFRSLWREIFNSWLTETTWGRSDYIPSVDEYLQTSMISIATHILVLISSCFLNPSLPENKVKPQQYENITQSLMATTRLLNDIQSYQKEKEEGTPNLVLLHINQNPDASIDDSISEVKRLLDEKRNELLKHVFTDDDDGDFPNQWKYLHLSCFKVFQMLFNSANLFDTDSELHSDIEKAIYVSPKHEFPKYIKPHTTFHVVPKKGNMMTSARYVQIPTRRIDYYRMNIHQLSKKSMRNVSSKVLNSTMFGL